MKRMIYNIPVATLGIYMNAQKVKVGYWSHWTSSFYEDTKVYEGSMGDLMFKKENRDFWNEIKMKKVMSITAENDYVIIGVDRFDA